MSGMGLVLEKVGTSYSVSDMDLATGVRSNTESTEAVIRAVMLIGARQSRVGTCYLEVRGFSKLIPKTGEACLKMALERVGPEDFKLSNGDGRTIADGPQLERQLGFAERRQHTDGKRVRTEITVLGFKT